MINLLKVFPAANSIITLLIASPICTLDKDGGELIQNGWLVALIDKLYVWPLCKDMQALSSLVLPAWLNV